VHAHKLQTVSTGDSQNVEIAFDQTVTVEGARTVTTTGQDSLTAKNVLVKALAEGAEIDGTPKVKVHAGDSNYVIVSNAGEIAVDAAKQIGLAVAGNQLFVRQGTITATAGIEISLEVGGTSVKVNTAAFTSTLTPPRSRGDPWLRQFRGARRSHPGMIRNHTQS
jgi:hypothetical protein